MKTAKELIIPFTWENRYPVLLDRFLYVPDCYDHQEQVYRAQEDFVNFDSASQSIIDSHFEHHSQLEKGEKQNRLGEGAASQNSQKLTERGIFPFFDQKLPIVIEYCSGNGQWIGERARQNPQYNWIAVEKKFERARKIWLLMHRERLPNLFVVRGEAVIFTRFYAPRAVEVYVNFPDPWPKLRHAKHRLVRLEFLQELEKIVEQKGKITCVTDDVGYAAEMTKEFGKCPAWNLLDFETQRPSYGNSYFKDLWDQRGRTIHYLTYEKL